LKVGALKPVPQDNKLVQDQVSVETKSKGRQTD